MIVLASLLGLERVLRGVLLLLIAAVLLGFFTLLFLQIPRVLRGFLPTLFPLLFPGLLCGRLGRGSLRFSRALAAFGRC